MDLLESIYLSAKHILALKMCKILWRMLGNTLSDMLSALIEQSPQNPVLYWCQECGVLSLLRMFPLLQHISPRKSRLAPCFIQVLPWVSLRQRCLCWSVFSKMMLPIYSLFPYCALCFFIAFVTTRCIMYFYVNFLLLVITSLQSNLCERRNSDRCVITVSIGPKTVPSTSK